MWFIDIKNIHLSYKKKEMKSKIEEAFYLLLGVLGLGVALTILLAIIRIGELYANAVINL